MSFAIKMLEMLTSAYNRTDILELKEKRTPKTNIGKLFTLSGWGFDIIHDQTEKVRLWDDIDVMEGETLTRYGNGFGVARGEAEMRFTGHDQGKDHRHACCWRSRYDHPLGGIPFWCKCGGYIFSGSLPAKIYLYIDEDKLDQEHKNVADTIAGLMKRIKTTGVGIRIFYKTYSSKRAAVYVGTPTCVAAFINVAPMPLNKKSVKTIELKAGIGTLVCTRVSYPAIPREV